MTFSQKLKRNPLVWIFCLMVIYFAISGAELDTKVPAYFEKREHLSNLENDAAYAAEFEVEQAKARLMRKAHYLNPKEQVEAMLGAKKSGVSIESGCSGAIRKLGETDDALAACIHDKWTLGPGLTTGSHTRTILDKIERDGLPPAGVLQRWRMLADGCIPGDDSNWCRKFERAMQCTNHCGGSQMVRGSNADY